jgi:uncharacterized iron-regulated protein
MKNQGVDMDRTGKGIQQILSFFGRLFIGLAVLSLFWGCAVKSDTVLIKDTSAALEPGTIISAKSGETVTFEELMGDISSSQIIFVGEKHTNSAHHEIQLKIIEAFFKNHHSMKVGMEMLDRSYQPVLNLWSAGLLEEEDFLRKVHWYANWRWDFALYRDIFLFIKENRIKIIALNIPFHIPARIRVGGIDNLAAGDKYYLPKEIDTSNTAHRNYTQEVFNRHHFKSNVKFEDFYMAQCVWDEVMAESIASNLGNNKIVVLAGNGHIQYKYGIPDRTFRRTGSSFRTIYLASVGEQIELGVADYIWITPAN